MVLRIGVVGLGLGMSHVRAILAHPDKARLTAVCDTNPERLDRALDGVPKFSDFHRFMDSAPIDAVILAVPHHLHAPQAVEALNRGKHVLVEKPMARTSEECQAMAKAAHQANRTLMVAQNWRYTPWCVAIKRVLGELGPIRAVKTDWVQNIDMHSGGWLKDGEIAGGGPVISLVVHNLDYLRFLLGEVEEVYAMCHDGDPGFSNGAESWAMAQLKFESGVMGQMYTSYAAYAPTDAGMIYLYGDEGTVHTRPSADGTGPWIASKTRLKAEAHEAGQYDMLDLKSVVPELLPNPQENQLLHFVQCCQTGNEPLSGAKDNMRTIRLIEAIYASAKSGSVVQVNQPFGHI